MNATIVPSLSNAAFALSSDQLTLAGVEDLYVENDSMDPVRITVQDLESGSTLDLEVIAVMDRLASAGPVPVGFYVSPETIGREVDATQYFFNVSPGETGAAEAIEAAFFQNGVETLNVKETIADAQASQKALFSLLFGFMALGLFVGIAALGVISARAVVGRRHGIGVLRAIGFSRGMVQLSFLMESSFIALLGVAIGVILGTIISINLVDDFEDELEGLSFTVPWVQIVIIISATYIFSMITTFLPARQAARIPPAEALRYE